MATTYYGYYLLWLLLTMATTYQRVELALGVVIVSRARTLAHLGLEGGLGVSVGVRVRVGVGVRVRVRVRVRVTERGWSTRPPDELTTCYLLPLTAYY